MGEGAKISLLHPYGYVHPHRRNRVAQLFSWQPAVLGLLLLACCGGGARSQEITGTTYEGRAVSTFPVESGSATNKIAYAASFYVMPYFGPTSGGTWVRSGSPLPTPPYKSVT
jgi:hypothetical protein